MLRDKAVVLLERGEYQKASIDFEQVIKKEGGNPYYISNGNEWLATGRIEKVLFNLGKCYENIAETKTNDSSRKEFGLKALAAYEWHAQRQYLFSIDPSGKRQRMPLKGRFEVEPRNNASILLFGLKMCGYDKDLLKARSPYLYHAFHPFAFSPPEQSQNGVRIALLRDKASPDYVIAVATCNNDKLKWLTYQHPRRSGDRPSEIMLQDYDSDGESEVIVVWSGLERNIYDEGGSPIGRESLDGSVILKIIGEKVVALTELIDVKRRNMWK